LLRPERTPVVSGGNTQEMHFNATLSNKSGSSFHCNRKSTGRL